MLEFPKLLRIQINTHFTLDGWHEIFSSHSCASLSLVDQFDGNLPEVVYQENRTFNNNYAWISLVNGDGNNIYYYH